MVPIPNTAALVVSPRIHPSYAIQICKTARSNVPSQPHLANTGVRRLQLCTLMMIAAASPIARREDINSADQVIR